ncbi:hypothetical protein [Kitasatospora aureofaciens]|uniref:hypothetical protein n=1 Tax=Kitasatospora aureofaciens TaxID=1894 RepID=UPI00068BF926|nr:hypothetical protein [Kitasatospora aureofaciens]
MCTLLGRDPHHGHRMRAGSTASAGVNRPLNAGLKVTKASLGIGLAFGVTVSLVNALSSPYGKLGVPFTGTVWAGAAEVLSLLLGAGWAWAALAVATGWLARTWRRGALAGALSLVTATGAYYMADALFRDEPLALYRSELAWWWAASLLFGVALGAVGAASRRPGAAGLLAALTVPVGAAAQMVLLPPRPHPTPTLVTVLSEIIVWTAAVLGAGCAVQRFRVTRRASRTGAHHCPRRPSAQV